MGRHHRNRDVFWVPKCKSAHLSITSLEPQIEFASRDEKWTALKEVRSLQKSKGMCIRDRNGSRGIRDRDGQLGLQVYRVSRICRVRRVIDCDDVTRLLLRLLDLKLWFLFLHMCRSPCQHSVREWLMGAVEAVGSEVGGVSRA